MSELITPEYQALLRQKHKTKPWGGGGASWIPEIVRLMIEFQLRAVNPITREPEIAPSILDYGAGRHTFHDTMLWLMPHVSVSEYDPGVAGIDQWPPLGYHPALGKFDLVLCTDVMEHVEEQFVNATFKRIKSVTKHAVLFNIALTPSKSLLPNGANAHLTVQSAEWWMSHVLRVFTITQVLHQYKGFTFVAKP